MTMMEIDLEGFSRISTWCLFVNVYKLGTAIQHRKCNTDGEVCIDLAVAKFSIPLKTPKLILQHKIVGC
jgi:hypothetical protein